MKQCHEKSLVQKWKKIKEVKYVFNQVTNEICEISRAIFDPGNETDTGQVERT